MFSEFAAETVTWGMEPYSMAYTLDASTPTVAITAPTNNQQVKTLTTISGTEGDNPLSGTNVSGVNYVQVQILDLTAGSSYYSAGANAWSTTPVWNQVTPAAGTWAFSVLNTSFSTNHQYQIQAPAVDNQKNGSTSPLIDIVFDTTTPTGQITFPVNRSGNNGYYQTAAVTNAVVVSSDTGFGSINTIRADIYKLVGTTTFYYDPTANCGSNWCLPQTFLSTTTFDGINTWNVALPTASLTDGTTYSFGLQAKDQAGNYMTIGTSVTFVIDNTSPTVTTTLPVSASPEATYRTFAQITGTAADNFPIVVSSIAFFAAGSAYWNGSDWTGGTPTWYTVTGTTNWTFNWATAGINLSNFDSYRIEIFVKAQDAAGNYTTVGPTTIFRVDNSSPTSSFTSPAISTSTIWLNSLASFHGIAQANPNNYLQFVHLHVKRGLDSQYWGGASWGKYHQHPSN